LWNHIFHKKLKISPEVYPIFMTETSLNLTPNREKMTQILFESFNVPEFYVDIQALLSLFGCGGRTTGVVVDIGDDVTQIVPIYDSHILPHVFRRVNFAGKCLTNYLSALLNGREESNCKIELETISEIKENSCYVSVDYNKEPIKEASYKLPDGNSIKIGSERFKCTEILFQPKLFDLEFGGIHVNIFKSIQKSDLDTRKDLYSNIVLSGGSSMFGGISERITKEMGSLSSMKVKVIDPPERKYSAWIGGSILTSLSSFGQMWISKFEYEEEGPVIVHRKCKSF
jgi:actin, other eukaryote